MGCGGFYKKDEDINRDNKIIEYKITDNRDINNDKKSSNSTKKTKEDCQQVNSFDIINQKYNNKALKLNVSNKGYVTNLRNVQNIIYKQMGKCICKINNNKSFGTGFFCNIPFPNYLNFLPVLITNNHILQKKDISPNSCITFSINDEENENDIYKIIIGDNRLTYTDEFYDVTIIELKKDDKLDILGLEVDYEEYEAPLDEFKNLQIYLIHYPRSKNVCKSIGEIKYISEKELTIKHTCSTAEGSSGSPIINLNNLKVLGVHKGSLVSQNFNVGTFIKGPIEKFNEVHKTSIEINQRPSTFLKYIDNKDINIDMEKKEQKKKISDMNISFIFTTGINLRIPCSPDNSFLEVENKLYRKLYAIYPEFKNSKISFIFNAMSITDKYKPKTIKELGLKDNDKVIVIIIS